MLHRNVHIVEQTSCLVADISEGQAIALKALGARMRGKSRNVASENPDVEESRSIIDVTRIPGENGHRILVRNAIGVISVDEIQILVLPKVDLIHFGHLSTLAGDPMRLRLGEGQLHIDPETGYLPSIWIAYLDALSITLKADLHHDYVERNDDPPYVRGRLDLRATFMNIGQGRLTFPSQFDELYFDNPVNRVLRAAALLVATRSHEVSTTAPPGDSSPQTILHSGLSKRARELAFHLGGVSDIRPGDLYTPLPRLALHQRRAVELARHILSGVGRSVRVGSSTASCFLHTTPDIVESAIRNLLSDKLKADFDVCAGHKRVGGLDFNPDLVLASRGSSGSIVHATGDVKYRLRQDDWPRSVLEQCVMFSQVFQAPRGFFVDFVGNDATITSRQITINVVKFGRFSWNASPSASPETSADHLVHEIEAFLFASD